MFGSVKSVFQQGGYCHGSYSARDGGDPSGPFAGRFELDIAYQAAVVHAVDADINDDGARFDPLPFDQPGLSYADHQDIRPAHFIFEIIRKAVGCGGGAACQQQLHGHRATNNIGCADDDRIATANGLTGTFQQSHHAFWCAGAEQGNTLYQTPDIVRVEAVHILVGADAFNDRVGIDVVWEWQLNQYAVDSGVFVEFINQLKEFGLAGGARKVVGDGVKAYPFAVLPFFANIDPGSGVVANQDYGQTGLAQPRLLSQLPVQQSSQSVSWQWLCRL